MARLHQDRDSDCESHALSKKCNSSENGGGERPKRISHKVTEKVRDVSSHGTETNLCLDLASMYAVVSNGKPALRSGTGAMTSPRSLCLDGNKELLAPVTAPAKLPWMCPAVRMNFKSEERLSVPASRSKAERQVVLSKFTPAVGGGTHAGEDDHDVGSLSDLAVSDSFIDLENTTKTDLKTSDPNSQMKLVRGQHESQFDSGRQSFKDHETVLKVPIDLSSPEKGQDHQTPSQEVSECSEDPFLQQPFAVMKL